MTAAKRMLTLLGKPPKMMDSDRDGVPNIIDCRPFDKTKQDITVTVGGKKIGGWWKKKREQIAERRAEARGYRETERIERRKAEHEERLKYAKEKEKIKTETALKAFRRRRESGGIVGQFMTGFKRPSPVKKVSYTRKGKKGKVTRRRTTAPVEPRRKSLSEHMSQFRF